MIWMDVDAALSEVPVNIAPLIDDTDFKSIEASVAYNAGGMALKWNFVTTAGAYTQTAVTPTTGGDYDWTSQGNGMYSLEIPASGGASINNDAEGFGWFSGVATGVLPWRGPVIGFRAAALNNALIDGTTIDVNVTAIANGAITAASIATGAIDADAIADDAIDAGSIKADAVTKIQNGLATPTNITAGTITTVTNLTNAPTNGDLTATMKASVTTAATAATPTAAAVTGAVGSVTGNVGGNVAGSVASVVGNVGGSVVGTVKLDATQSAYAPAKAGDAMTLTSGERTSIAAAVWNALTSGMSTVGSIGKKLADWVVGTIDTYTGNTKQTGDAFARLGAPSGASVSADIEDVRLVAATAENYLADPDFGLVAVKGDTAASKTILDRLNGMIVIDGAVYQFTANALELSPAGGSVPTASQVADAVWDEALSGHGTAGSAGAALSTAGAGGISPELQEMIESTYAGVTALQGVSIELASPMGQGGTVSILWGYDYYSTDGTVPTWNGTNWPDLTGATLGIVDFSSHASLGGTVTGTSVGGATQTVKWEIPDATFTGAASGKYILEATLTGGNKVPLAIGQLLRQ